MFKPANTIDHSTSYLKTVLFGDAGWGKTTNMAHMQEHYGEGFIISGESGLSSIRSAGIDYLPFNSWGGRTNPEANEYSFVDIFRWMKTPDFKSREYKWIGLDSLTELSSHSLRAAEKHCKEEAEKMGKKPNGFEAWAIHGSQLVGACKAIRDMPMHFLCTALAKSSQDENGNIEHWPMVDGKATIEKLPGSFDCVFAGLRATSGDNENQSVVRYIVTDDVRGWKGKVRDEKRRLAAIEKTGSVVDLFKRMELSDADFKKYQKTQEQEQ